MNIQTRPTHGSARRWPSELILVVLALLLLAAIAAVFVTGNRDRGPSGAVGVTAPAAKRPGRSVVTEPQKKGQAHPTTAPQNAPQTEAERLRAQGEAVAAEKAEYFKRPPPAKLELTDEFKNNPELYDPGPGPYLAFYEGRSGANSPWARPEDAEVTTVLSSQEAHPMLHAWVRSIRVSAGKPARIQAVLRDEEQKRNVEASTVSARIVERGSGIAVDQVLALTQSPEGPIYQVEFTPPTSDQKVREYQYVIRAQGALDEEPFDRNLVGGFYVHNMTTPVDEAKAEVVQENGNIIVKVPVEVSTSGNYHAYADLWAGPHGDIPVAIAQQRFDGWAPGKHSIELMFGGKILRDAKRDGPYTIRNLRFTRVDVDPIEEAETVPVLLTTPAWIASSFY